MSTASSHGETSDGISGFARLLDAQTVQPAVEALRALAMVMLDEPDGTSDEPDPEENLIIPAGYTYFGQFVDHDLTFDIGTNLDDIDPSNFINARSPRFDLDNVYGPGPDAAPFMYEKDGVHLIRGNNDLPRVVLGRDEEQKDILGRAIIGDPRNDENSIVCNLQMKFIDFHNAVADKLAEKDPSLQGNKKNWFIQARREVRWTYQVIVVRDFLKRIVNEGVLRDFDDQRQPDGKNLSTNPTAFKFFPPQKRSAIPLEFAGAAYRYGHSAIRFGYRLSKDDKSLLSIFSLKKDPMEQDNPEFSLVGFSPLPPAHVIDKWERFFPAPDSGHDSATPGKADQSITPEGPDRLQFAYRIDTTLTDPLSNLPPSVAGTGPINLAERNLLRGRTYKLPTGQQAAAALGVTELPAGSIRVRTKLRREVIEGKEQWVESFLTPQQAFISLKNSSRAKAEEAAKLPNVDLDQFLSETPLWFYVLVEAQQKIFDWSLDKANAEFTEKELLQSGTQTVTQLGDVGGRIVAEVFHGLLDADKESYRNSTDGAAWLSETHLIKDFTMWHLVNANLKA